LGRLRNAQFDGASADFPDLGDDEILNRNELPMLIGFVLLILQFDYF
jgi:hypothetical protein